MTKVRLHGILAKEFGEFFSFRLGKAKDVIRAIDANKKNFIKRINDLGKQGFNYTLVVDGKKVSELSEIEIKKEHKNIEIVPMIAGSGVDPITIGLLIQAALGSATATSALAVGTSSLAGALAVGGASLAATSFAIGTIALAAVSIGLQMLLAPKPDAGPPISATTKAFSESFSFSNKANVAAQGTPVPVGYGRLRVGSQVVQYSSKSFPQSESSTQAMTANPFNIIEEGGFTNEVANVISNRL